MTLRAPRAVGLALVAGLACAPAAQAQGLADWGRIILGLPAEEGPPIDYRERAPLVVPPDTGKLRPPAPGGGPEGRRANWPQDPEAVARRRQAEDARRPVMVDSITGREIGGPVRRMTPEEIRQGRIAGAEIPQGVAERPRYEDRDFHNVMGGLTTLREMDRRSTAAAGDGSLDRTEPRRQFLTDPPAGVRRPADNAAFRATREGSLGARPEPHPLDIFRDGPNTR